MTALLTLWAKKIFINKYTLMFLILVLCSMASYYKGRQDMKNKYARSQLKEVIEYVDEKNKVTDYYDSNKFDDEWVLSGIISKNSKGCISSDGMCDNKR